MVTTVVAKISGKATGGEQQHRGQDDVENNWWRVRSAITEAKSAWNAFSKGDMIENAEEVLRVAVDRVRRRYREAREQLPRQADTERAAGRSQAMDDPGEPRPTGARNPAEGEEQLPSAANEEAGGEEELPHAQRTRVEVPEPPEPGAEMAQWMGWRERYRKAVEVSRTSLRAVAKSAGQRAWRHFIAEAQTTRRHAVHIGDLGSFSRRVFPKDGKPVP